MSKKLIVHHNDLDGRIGGCICRSVIEEADTWELDYNIVDNYLDKDLYVDYDEVVIVDFSFPHDMMCWLNDNKDVSWIDHHISAIKDSEKHGYDKMDGLRDVGRSSAELAWEYFYVVNPPRFVKLVGEYDTFRTCDDKHRFDGVVMPFFYGAMNNFARFDPKDFHHHKFMGNMYNLVSDEFVDKTIKRGKLLYQFVKNKWRDNHKNAFVRQMFGGLRTLCLNTVEQGPMQLEELFDDAKHDLMLVFGYNGTNWKYGLYAPSGSDIDVSVIAKKHGGGGHAKASGFVTDELMAELVSD